MATPVSQTRMWRLLRLVYLASRILDTGLKPDRVQICAHLKSTTSTASVLLFLGYFLDGTFRISALAISASEVYHFKSHLLLHFCFCLNRILTSRFLFLADYGGLSQTFASLLGPWENISANEVVRWASTGEIKAHVHGEEDLRD